MSWSAIRKLKQTLQPLQNFLLSCQRGTTPNLTSTTILLKIGSSILLFFIGKGAYYMLMNLLNHILLLSTCNCQYNHKIIYFQVFNKLLQVVVGGSTWANRIMRQFWKSIHGLDDFLSSMFHKSFNYYLNGWSITCPSYQAQSSTLH